MGGLSGRLLRPDYRHIAGYRAVKNVVSSVVMSWLSRLLQLFDRRCGTRGGAACGAPTEQGRFTVAITFGDGSYQRLRA